MTALLADMTPEQAARAGREIARFRHRLDETGLFTDEALARLIDEHPRSELTVCTMRDDPPPQERWIAGEADGLDGAALVEAARRGSLWVSPRSAMTRNPRYKAVFDRLMAEFSQAVGVRVLSADAAVLISSARMGIFFHVDPAETMLWHVRGHKTVYVYPPREEHVTEQALEAILLKETLSDLPYDAAMETGVQALEMKPGDAAYWPMHSPHRVVNGEDLNVSVSVEFSSPRSMLTNGVFYTNGVLRRRLGFSPVSRNKPQALKPLYWAAARAIRTLAPPKANAERDHARAFDVDLSAPRCVRWRDGFGPQARAA
jgi:uncharacterized RmlC-like cupin family protein